MREKIKKPDFVFNKFPKGQRYAKVVEKLVKEMVSLAVVNIVIKIPIVIKNTW